MSDLTVRTEPLGGSPLARALFEGGPASEWIAAPPRGGDAWRTHARSTVARFRGGAWLAALHDAIVPADLAATRLTRIAAEGGVLVTTGQQPGLFGGPIYTWSKAMSALALADAIESATGVPAAPLFWAATDDSDFVEAASTMVAVPGGVETLRLPHERGDARMMSHVPLPAMTSLLAQLERGAGSAVHREVLDDAARAYHDGATVGGAYVALLRALLHPLGIGVLDAAHPSVARAARPVLVDALRRAESIAASLAARDADIRVRSLEPQVALVPGLTLVFRRDGGTRSRVPIRDGPAMAASDVELGPNVLLRPIVEREILPTVAYMAGPGEIAYFAQVSAVADALERTAPLALGRWSGTIIEPHVARILERYGLAPDDLRHPTAAETALARTAMPADAAEALVRFRAQIDELAASLATQSPLVAQEVVEGHRRTLHHRVDRLERRLLAGVKRRQSDVARELATARGALFPAGTRQERSLNLLPMLARHGPRLLDLMRERAAEHAHELVAGERVAAGAGR